MAWTKNEQAIVSQLSNSIDLLKSRQSTTDGEIDRIRDAELSRIRELELRLTRLEERRLSDEQSRTRTIATLAVIISACSILANIIINWLKK